MTNPVVDVLVGVAGVERDTPSRVARRPDLPGFG
jgi:hypothetical protein